MRRLPDRLYLRLLYRIKIGRWPNLRQPRRFTEKIQWLKLNWRYPILTRCADKVQVRQFVADRIGPGVLKGLYGVYERPEDIDAGPLPDAFVLKVNHGCRQNLFCRAKAELDWGRAARQLRAYLKDNLYPYYREWAYKDIPPRILCEEYLAKDGDTLYECGFYCYEGVPRVVEINEHRAGVHRVSMFDLELNRLENRYGALPLSPSFGAPPQYALMREYAAALSAGFPFVRVDLWHTNGRIYFGEMTFSPLAGLSRLNPDSFDDFLGSFWRCVDNLGPELRG